MNVIRIGTRSSPLALWQATETARLLLDAGYQSEIVPVRTTGDLRRDVPLAVIGGKGLFVKELEEALDRREIDIAVHSLKDVPSIIPERFGLVGFLERADPRDVWIQRKGVSVENLPPGATVATSSPRRRAQLLARRPDLTVLPIRGNVETRLAKLENGECEGLVLARAGLDRLGLRPEHAWPFSTDEMVPAAGQGIVAVEALRSNLFAKKAAAAIDHASTALVARAERGVLQHFETRLDCLSCIAVHATADEDGGVTLRAFVSDLDATVVIRLMRYGRDVDALVRSVGEELVACGALGLLEVCTV